MFDAVVPPQPVLQGASCVQTDVGPIWLPADDKVLLPYMQETGCWEPAEAQLLRRLLTPTSRFLDVGAHVGYFSLFAARINVLGSVDAVEPDPKNLELLKMNLWQTAPKARIWGAALGCERRVGSLTSEAHNSGNTCVTKEAATAAALAAVMRGDELFPKAVFDLIKLDVQGAESDALLGLRGVLQRSPDVRIIAEFFPGAMVHRGIRPTEALALYRRLGLRWVASVQGLLSRLQDEALLNLCNNAGPNGFVNLLLTRQSC